MLAALLVAVAVVLPPEPARKLPSRLPDLVDASTFVCIGTVDEVFTVPCPEGFVAVPGFQSPPERGQQDLRFARIRVEHVLKGDPSTKVMFHEAWSTWTCDTTSDVAGVRSLFLLGPGMVADAAPEQRVIVERALGTDGVLRNVGSGDGIMRIRGKDADAYVYCSGAPAYMDHPNVERGKKLVDVVSYTETLAKFAPDRVAVHARCNARRPLPVGSIREETDSFDLRILPDGSRRLAVRLGTDERVVVDALPPDRWEPLRDALEREVGEEYRTFGPSSTELRERSLSVKTAKGSLVFADHYPNALLDLPAEDRSTVEASLRAWAAIAATMACPTCTDYTASDKRWLDGERTR